MKIQVELSRRATTILIGNVRYAILPIIKSEAEPAPLEKKGLSLSSPQRYQRYGLAEAQGIRADHKKGLTAEEIAIKYKRTVKGIDSFLKRYRDESKVTG